MINDLSDADVNPYLPPSTTDAAAASRPTNIRHLVVAAATLSSVMLYLDRVCIAEIAKLEAFRADLNLSKEQVAVILGAFFFPYALAQVPTGWLCDRFGARIMMVIYIVAWSLFTILTGFATGFAMLLGIRLLFGVAQAGAYPASAGLIRNWVPLANRGKVSSMVALGGRVGGAVALVLTSALVIPLGGWPNVLTCYGLLGLLVAWLFWRWFRDFPAQHPDCNLAEQALISPAAFAPGPADLQDDLTNVPETTARHAGPLPTGKHPLLRMVGSGSMWLMCVAQFTTNIGWTFLVTLLPSFFEEKSVPPLIGGLMGTVVLLFGIVGMLLGGWLTDWASRIWGVRWGRSLPLAATRLLAAGAFLSCLWCENPWGYVAAFAVVAFATDLGVASVWAFVQDVGGRYTASVLGWGNMWGNFGSFASPIFVVWVNRRWDHDHDWREAFILLAVSFAISGVAALGIDATLRLAPDEH